LSAVVAHNKARIQFFDGPRRREAATKVKPFERSNATSCSIVVVQNTASTYNLTHEKTDNNARTPKHHSVAGQKNLAPASGFVPPPAWHRDYQIILRVSCFEFLAPLKAAPGSRDRKVHAQFHACRRLTRNACFSSASPTKPLKQVCGPGHLRGLRGGASGVTAAGTVAISSGAPIGQLGRSRGRFPVRHRASKEHCASKEKRPRLRGPQGHLFSNRRSRTFKMNVCSSCTNERLTFSILGWSITAVVIALFVFNAFALTG